MSTTNHNNSNNIIKIPLSAKLKEEGIIKDFVKHKISNSLEIIVNHKVERNTVYVSSIDKKSLEDICKEVDKRLKEIDLDQNQRLLIKNTINNEWKLIIGLCDPCDIYEEPNNNNNSTNLITYPKEDNEEQEQQHKEGKIIDDDTLEIITPSQALRKDITEHYKVKGTITSISKPFKMVLGIQFYCDRCKQHQEFLFPLPIFEIPNYFFPICNNCKQFGRIRINMVKPIYINSIGIEVQNYELFNDLESLPVFLFNENTEGVRVGETVIIKGVINILNIKKRNFTYFYAESVQYLNREDSTLTESDIRITKRFANIHKGHVIDKLVSMFDPSIVENDLVKRGILMSAVNTSDKIKEESEHIDILFIGPPGLGKTKILRRATELVPGSSNAGGQYSTGKSLTAIIDKTNDNTILKLGLVPRSRAAFCAINEFGRQHLEDQDKMLDVMEERWFPFSKYGFNIDIPVPTAILASANPVNKDRWIDDDKIDLNQFPFLDPIIDRFDLVFPLHDKKTQKERDEFADKLSVIEAKKAKKLLPDYTQFLIKYIRYAKQFNPVVLTDEARIMLTEFYKKISNTGFGSPRILKTLFKLAKAIARLKLKNVVDEEDAKEVMEFYNVILVNFQKSVVISQSPKYIAYEKGVEIVERFQESGGVTLEVLFEIMCKEDKQLALYFGYGEKPLKIRDNIKVRDVYELLVKNSNIIKIGEKPIVLKWLCDPCDVCDPNKISKNIQNEEKNSVKPNENELEPGSHGSHTSHNMEEEKQKEEHEYGIKLGKDANLPIL